MKWMALLAMFAAGCEWHYAQWAKTPAKFRAACDHDVREAVRTSLVAIGRVGVLPGSLALCDRRGCLCTDANLRLSR